MSLNARSYAFDAGVIFLFYAGVPSVRAFFDRVFAGRASGFVSEVNLAEFYYKTAEKKGVDVAEIQYRQVRGSPLKVVAPDENTTREAALWKFRNRTLSLADCFAIATWRERAQILLTTDSELAKLRGVKSEYISVP